MICMSRSRAPHRAKAGGQQIAEAALDVERRKLTRCLSCREPLYATFPLRTFRDGAMHVGCYVLWARTGVTVVE
jgi:hypothetical protein